MRGLAVHLSRLGELLNTLENVHFLPPPGRPGRSGGRAAVPGPSRALPAPLSPRQNGPEKGLFWVPRRGTPVPAPPGRPRVGSGKYGSIPRPAPPGAQGRPLRPEGWSCPPPPRRDRQVTPILPGQTPTGDGRCPPSRGRGRLRVAAGGVHLASASAKARAVAGNLLAPPGRSGTRPLRDTTSSSRLRFRENCVVAAISCSAPRALRHIEPTTVTQPRRPAFASAKTALSRQSAAPRPGRSDPDKLCVGRSHIPRIHTDKTPKPSQDPSVWARALNFSRHLAQVPPPCGLGR